MKMPKGETRFNADAWVQVWITQKELTEDPEVEKIKQLELDDEYKVELIKNRAAELAQDKLNFKTCGLEISNDSFEEDEEFNHIDWEAILK